MKTLVTAIKKGGQGKTCVSCHLAFDFQDRGCNVVVIDFDTQANASYTLESQASGFTATQLFTDGAKAVKAHFSDYEGDGLALIEADLQLANLERLDYGAAAKALRASLDQLAEYFDVCIIDTAPSLGVAMTAAVLAGDFVLSPVEMEAYSIHGMKKLVQVIANLRQSNPGLQFMGMLPNKVDRRKPRHVANLEALRDAYPDYVLPVSVGSRDSIAEALGEQRPVWAIKKTAARVAIKEMRAVAQHVFEKMEIEQ